MEINEIKKIKESVRALQLLSELETHLTDKKKLAKAKAVKAKWEEIWKDLTSKDKETDNE